MSGRMKLATFCLLFASNVSAQSVWTGAADTEWSNPANWQPQALPTADTVISLQRFEPSTINIDSPVTVNGIAFDYPYEFTGAGPLRFEGADSIVEASESVYQTPTFDVPIVLASDVEFHPNRQFHFAKDIDVTSFEFEAFGNISLAANILGQGSVTLSNGDLSGTGSIEPDVKTFSSTIKPHSKFTFLGDAQIDAEIDLASEAFDIIDGGGQGTLEIGRLVLNTSAIPNLNSEIEFNVFPGWDSVSVDQIILPRTQVDFDASRISEGLLKINFLEPFLCDLDGNGFCDVVDLDMIGESIRTDSYVAANDLNNDEKINLADRDEWISLAGIANGRPHYLGDADFNGQVDAADLMRIGTNWQSHVSSYSDGDFNFDGIVNVHDLNAVGRNWQAGVPPRSTAVPEPASHLLMLFAVAAIMKLLQHRAGQTLCVVLLATVTTITWL